MSRVLLSYERLPLVSALPSGQRPDGEVVRYADATVNNLDWTFMFHAGLGWPWVFVGGPPLIVLDGVSETRGPSGVANAVFSLSAAARSPVLPQGIYDIETDVIVYLTAGTAAHTRIFPRKPDTSVLGTGALDWFMTLGAANEYRIYHQGKQRITTDSDTAIQLCASIGNTSMAVAYAIKQLTIYPVRLSPRP